MIKISNLTKSFNSRHVLKNLNHTFPSKGLCIIYGASGSGKTTLLNCLAGLILFEGSIALDNLRLEELNENEMSQLRLKKYGFIFQDFKLFDNETVQANLLFPLETLYHLSKEKKKRKCEDLLSLVGLFNKEKQIVNKLSGGEKQRVAIARALINDPGIILADEPTGALDEKNGQEIMKILKIISKKSLIIMVSHDAELTQKYADQIIKMEDGTIKEIIDQDLDTNNGKHLPILNNGLTNKKSKIPSNFLLKHTYHNMKQKKFRSMICYSMTSLGLLGVGLAFALSSMISKNIKHAYKEIIDESSIMFSLKEKNQINSGKYSSTFYDVEKIKETYPDYVNGVGVTYYTNFEQFFIDSNALAISNNQRYIEIPGFSARHINDFVWLEDLTAAIYPKDYINLEDDEVILGLTYETMVDVCYELRIERSVGSLSDYLLQNATFIYFDLANFDWTYTDQQIVRWVGFTLERDNKIYHSNHLWNEYMFEERMRFPSSQSIDFKETEPWIMKKIYYLKTNENRDSFLNLYYLDKDSDNYILEIANENYYPWLYYDKRIEEIDRVLVFDNNIHHIPFWHIDYILENDTNLNEPLIGNDSGYKIYPESLMMGYAKTMYISKDINKIENIIDTQTSSSDTGFYKEDVDDEILSGNFAISVQNGVNFSVFAGNLAFGHPTNSLDEIVLSSKMYNDLGLSSLDETIYITTSKREVIVGGNTVLNDYQIVPLKVVGIIKSNKRLMFHDMFWTTLFFQCKIGISAFDLTCQNLSFSLKNANKINDSIMKAKESFPQYEINNPLSDVNESVDTVCFYVTIVLVIFSTVAAAISIMLLTICNYLYILEGKKEIALSRCLGVSKNESKKFLHFNSIINCLVSFVIASFELLIVSIVTNLEVGSLLSLGFSFSFDPFALLPMLILSCSIGLFSSLVMSHKITKINPIEALKA